MGEEAHGQLRRAATWQPPPGAPSAAHRPHSGRQGVRQEPVCGQHQRHDSRGGPREQYTVTQRWPSPMAASQLPPKW